jgi:hypothetical protein
MFPSTEVIEVELGSDEKLIELLGGHPSDFTVVSWPKLS